MIRAIICDVDGVIVGATQGVNFPLPNEKVLEKLHHICQSGIPVILCTAKSLYPILPIIEKAQLHNFHIADGGAVIANPLQKDIEEHPLSKEILEKIVYYATENNIYIELHALGKYFIEKNEEDSTFTDIHTKIMQQQPIIVPSLLEIIEQEKIIKIILFVAGPEDMSPVDSLLEGLRKEVSSIWTVHPTMLPAQAAILTAHGVSKKHAAQQIVKDLGISFDEVLGIGDTKGDWLFMELCKYVGVMENGSDELKKLAKTKEEGNYFLAPSVEQDGILLVFDHFGI